MVYTSTGLNLATNDNYAEMRVIRNSTFASDKDMYLQFQAGANSKLFMYSNNTQTMTLSGGAVGIGTATPSASLHVAGNTRTNSIEMNAGGGAKQIANGVQAGGADRGTTNFPFTFTNVPIVVASIRQDIGDTVYDVQIVSVSTTGFTYRKTFYRFGGGFGGGAVSEEFNWIAMG